MQISIIGFSSIVERKILPALNQIERIKKVNIFSRREIKLLGNFNFELNLKSFLDLEKSLKEKNCYFYYLSFENSLHEELTKLVLNSKNNIIVDKPIFLTKNYFEEIIKVAIENECFISESLTWTYHSQLDYLKKFLSENDSFEANMRFTIPLPKKDNFRVNSSYGSGVYYDMASYFYSTAEILGLYDISKPKFFGKIGEDKPQWFHSQYNNSKKKLDALFGFGFSYDNSLELISESTILKFHRLFTSDSDKEVIVSKTNYCENFEYRIKDDSFKNYFIYMINLLDKKDINTEYQKIKSRYEYFFYNG